MFEKRPEAELRVDAYLLSPAKVHTTKDAVWRGNMVSQRIAECQAMIEKLKAYQAMLFDRVQEIEQAPFHSEVELVRHKSYYEKHVTYTMRILRVYDVPGIDPLEEEKTIYAGTDRRQALKDFDAIQKSRPGIIAHLNIEKSKWER